MEILGEVIVDTITTLLAATKIIIIIAVAVKKDHKNVVAVAINKNHNVVAINTKIIVAINKKRKAIYSFSYISIIQKFFEVELS